ncbi:hypothetical protein [Paenibacillus terrigena]|uniref:hypothetical protein n=1 Tax=Paenibacillus terrigena TaxID=369333 RepID=UPI000375155A|nr:hypothetical protein [Paenibacillus terrigena]
MSTSQLMTQTFEQLMQQLAPDAGIAIEVNTRWVKEMAHFLNEYDMDDARRQCILGCYVLLRLSLQSHGDVQEEKLELTRKILDGDYLQSIYYEYALANHAMDLLNALAPVIKTIHIRRIEGKPAEFILPTAIHQFVTYRYSKAAYEVI